MVIYASVKQCDLSDQVYNTDYHLKRHQVASHPLQETISCCDQIFTYINDYQKHRALLHTDRTYRLIRNVRGNVEGRKLGEVELKSGRKKFKKRINYSIKIDSVNSPVACNVEVLSKEKKTLICLYSPILRPPSTLNSLWPEINFQDFSQT